MELDYTNSGTTAKLPILKLENGDSWVSVPQTTQENGTSVTKMSIPVTAKEKTNKKNDVKARSLLLMALPNEHQLTFSQYPDVKSMFSAIETKFGVSTASPNVNVASPQVSTASVNDNTVNGFEVAALSAKCEGKEVLSEDRQEISLMRHDVARAPRSKESQFRNQDNTRKQGNNKDKSSKAMLSIDGVGFYWSDMAEEQV
ncbi:hypothetical protein Tco_0158168 [Tanacetum coccineum]